MATPDATPSLDTRILVARGLVQDLVSNLARLMASRVVTGAEEVQLQDAILGEALRYVKELRVPGAASVSAEAAVGVDKTVAPIPFGMPKAKTT